MGSPERWSGRIGFILSTIGSAIGLGSIWKFPYEVGSNGGGAFLFFYILGLVLVVVPLMLLEFAMGRHGRSDAVGSIAVVASASGASKGWRLIGALGILTSYLILSFYSVIGGWALYYLISTLQEGLVGGTAVAAQARFDAMLASPWVMTSYHLTFMAMVAAVVARGIANGIEAACKVLMPILIVLIVILAVYSMSEGDIGSALRFLFAIQPTSFSAGVALDALGLGFFSIGVGLSVMITYGSYAASNVDLRQVAVATIVGDTLVSCLAGLAVFPIVFAEKLDPASGPGLMFVTLPLAFARLPLGTPAALTFFLLLVIAALASAVSLLELPTAFLQTRLSWPRPRATVFAASTCAALGLVSILSFNLWADWHPLGAIGLEKATAFDLLDELTSNVLLPITGFGLAVFGGWVMAPELLAGELHLGRFGTAVLRGLLRFVIPASVAAAALAFIRF